MSKVYIVGRQCRHREELNKHFTLKVLAGAVAGFGFWAWVAYFFAGTGFALPICIALVAGGAGICAFSDEIAEWVSKKYDCPNVIKDSGDAFALINFSPSGASAACPSVKEKSRGILSVVEVNGFLWLDRRRFGQSSGVCHRKSCWLQCDVL